MCSESFQKPQLHSRICMRFHCFCSCKKKEGEKNERKVSLRSSYNQITSEGLNVLLCCTICWNVRQRKRKKNNMKIWKKKRENVFYVHIRFLTFFRKQVSYKQFQKLFAVMIGFVNSKLQPNSNLNCVKSLMKNVRHKECTSLTKHLELIIISMFSINLHSTISVRNFSDAFFPPTDD